MTTDVPQETHNFAGTSSNKNATYIISLEDYLKLKPLHGAIQPSYYEDDKYQANNSLY